MIVGLSLGILGCARDCATFLPKSLANVESAAAMFGDHRIFIFENDSADRTPAILRRFCARDPARRNLLSERFLIAKIPGRTRRLAYTRQRLHHALYESGFQPDVVIVMDLDDVGAGSPEHLRAFIYRATRFAGWHAAFPRLSYDVVAWHPWPAGADRRKSAQAMVEGGDSVVRVSSSFNGVGVYMGRVYALGRYMLPGQPVAGRGLPAAPCEHIVFHASLGPRARLVVLRDQIWP